MLLAFLMSSCIFAISPISNTIDNEQVIQRMDNESTLAASSMNVSIPYVDTHYGSADGIIDPTEYACSFTDPVTGIKSYFEHNGTLLYIGVEAHTTGWIGFAWQNYTSNFEQAGLNNSDIIIGYAPGTTLTDMWRVQGTDAVTVHYSLSLRNGTMIQDSVYPDITSTDPVESLSALQMYKDAIIGMRVGEVRHFVIPATEAYTSTDHELYGQDLIYTITLERIYRSGVSRTINPADTSQIVCSDEHGTSTFQHLPDSNQLQIVAADGSDNGTTTQLEYVLRMNSTDSNDIPLFNSTSVMFPFVFMFGFNEELNGLPAQHSSWTEPAMVMILPNKPPTMHVLSPEEGAIIEWVSWLKLNVTDDFVRHAYYRLDNESWINLPYNFQTLLWETTLDFSIYSQGSHVITFNTTDLSNTTGLVYVNIVIDRPFSPLLGMRIDAIRSFIVSPNFGSRTEDTYTITNNGSAPINSIDIYLPERYESKLLEFTTQDTSGKGIIVVRLTNANGMIRWRLHFSNAIGFQESHTFKVITYLHSLFYLTNAQTFEYQLEFLRFPVVPYVLNKADFALNFEGGGSLTPNEEVPDLRETDLVPLTENKFNVGLRLYTENTIASRKTKITVDAWGWLTYDETISLENTGGSALATIPLTLPAYSSNIKIYDQVGALATSQTQAAITTGKFNETRALQINVAADRFGSQGFLSTFKYTFYVSYTVQASAYQSAAPNGIKLDFPIALLGDILILTHEIDIVFTVSVAASEVTEGYTKLYGVFDTTYGYVFYNQTQRDPATLSAVYQTTLGAAARPVLFSLIIGIIAAIYVSYRKVELPEEILGARVDTEESEESSSPKQTGAPPDLLSDFANLYSKKTALNIDLEKLDASRRRGKVKKREYMMREGDLKKQIEEIDSKLPSVKEELARHGPSYRDLIAQLELQDERIEGAKAGLRQLLLRKKKQRISRVAFEKSRQDYLKTIQKATSATDRILLTIQEEAGDV
jgi:hypothetical protein